MQPPPSQLMLRFVRQRFYFEIPFGRTLIGRLARCQLVLGAGGDRVSREHAELVRLQNRLYIKDLGSRNRTYVNGRDIREAGDVELHLGDRIEICEFLAELTNQRVPFDESGGCRVASDMDEVEPSSTYLVNATVSSDSSSQKGSPADTRLSALITIGKSVGNALRVDQVVETAVASILEIFPAADRCVIGFTSPQHTFSPKWWTVRGGNSNSEIRVSQRIFRHVLDTADSVLFDDAVMHFQSAESVLAGSLRSVMCAPLTDQLGQVVGMIQTDSHVAHRFNRDDLDIFAAVATQISLALNFSKLHSQSLEDAVIRIDCEQANAVQKQFLPSVAPQIEGYEFADYYSPARHVGGDYYDYIFLSDGRLAIVLGDVVGKGVPAALTMVKLATEMRTAFELVNSAAEVLTRLNRRLADTYITGAIMILDPKNHTLCVANAGHDSPFIRSADGKIEKFGEDTVGYPISVIEDYVYEESCIKLQPGDNVVVFSDGFVDAEDITGNNRFGLDRIEAIVRQQNSNATALARAIMDEVDAFTSGAPQFDDMCLVCLHRKPAVKC